mgnify:CR=1 FL=1
MTMYRQGDILLVAVKQLPPQVIPEQREGDIILALGEVTGHAHRIRDVECHAWSVAGQRYLVADLPVVLSHEEHGAITVAPGVYQVVRQKELDLSGEWRQVVD